MTFDQEKLFLKKIEDLFAENSGGNDNRLRQTTEQLARQHNELVARIASAFPSGDMEGHCHYHAEIIEQLQVKKAFWIRMRYELYRWGVLGFLLWLAFQVAHAIGIDLGKVIEKTGGLFK